MLSIAEAAGLELFKIYLARRERGKRKSLVAPSSDRLDIHLRDACVWSQRVEFFGFSVGKGLDSTIPLDFGVPRKFRKVRGSKITVSESTLLQPAGHYIVLGDPGAGKTTTIKRLISEFVSTPVACDDDLDVPILFRLGELSSDDNLLDWFTTLLAIDVTREPVPIRHAPRTADPSDATREVTRYRLLTPDGLPAEAAVAKRLDEIGAFVLLDGLDEIPAFARLTSENTIVSIVRHMRRARIVATCRSGDYTRPLEGFDSLEIVPLDRSQIRDIAHRWADNPNAFLDALSNAPFGDLASRPLFLCQLIVLHRNIGFLPGRRSEAYERILKLALADWDHYKRVERHSRYATFDPERKLDFLSSLAFFFSYTKPSQTFDSRLLAQAYAIMHNQFDLPPGEAELVVRELEGHTGILTEVSYERFAFCHRSLHEFLCARYLIRGILTHELLLYLKTDPAPVAVAASLASDPGKWFGIAIMHPRVREALTMEIASRFVARFMAERPVLGISDELGFAALHLWMLERSRDPFSEFFAQEGVRRSLAQLLLAYDVTHVSEERLLLSPRFEWKHREDFPVSRTGQFGRGTLQELLDIAGLRLTPARTQAGGQAVWHISSKQNAG